VRWDRGCAGWSDPVTSDRPLDRPRSKPFCSKRAKMGAKHAGDFVEARHLKHITMPSPSTIQMPAVMYEK
jgi:hypothetical protein